MRFRNVSMVAAIATAMATPSFSQDLANEVLGEFVQSLQVYGATVKVGSKSENGTLVEWRDLVVELPFGLGAMDMAFVKAKELGAGRVSLAYPDTMSTTLTLSMGEQTSTMNYDLNFMGVEHIVSGPKSARVSEYTIDTVAGDVLIPIDGSELKLAMTGMSGTSTRVPSGEMFALESTGKVTKMEMTQIQKADGAQSTVKTITHDMVTNLTANMMQNGDFSGFINGSQSVLAAFSSGRIDREFWINANGANIKGSSQTNGTVANYGIKNGSFQLEMNGSGTEIDLAFVEMPLPPMQVSIGSGKTVLNGPLTQSDAPLPARMNVALNNVVLSDTIWGMFDPTGILPREAATLNIDVSAQMKWLVDVMQMNLQSRTTPVEVDTVTINDITLSLAGASLTGDGKATLNNTTFPPIPVGSVTMNLKGGIGLLDKLMSMGLVPQQQGQMVKAMSGVFATPVEVGEDHLKSKVIFNENGGISVNGQRIK